MIDVKKLITGFLILAAAATCSGVILALVPHADPLAQTAGSQIAISTSTVSANANAFLPPESAADYDQYLSTSTLAATSSDPNNLTDAFATAFVSGVADANPDGPITDNGSNVIAHPDETAIANQVASTPGAANLQIPNWNIEASEQPIKIVPGSSEDNISSYSQQLSQVVNTDLVASNVQSIVSAQNPDPAQVGFVAGQMKQALNDALTLPTPKSLVPFQRSLVTMMVYEKNELALAENVGDDPVKTALILQGEESRYDAAMTNLQTQIKSASSLQGFSFGVGPQDSESRAMAFFDSALGIQTAHAQWLTFDSANFGEWILGYAKNVVLQILKNTLTALIQRKVLAWVQGSGAPRFITNWGETLVNAYQQTALNALNAEMSCGTFPAYIPTLKTTLGVFYQPGGNNFCANQFQAALGANTFQQFYNNFQNGGFLAFGASELPSGNPFGSMFFDAQIVGNNAQNAQIAAADKAISAQGQKGDEKCDDGSDPNNGQHAVCMSSNGANYTIDTTLQCPDGGPTNPDGTCDVGKPSPTESCDPSDTQVIQPNRGVCSDGSEPSVTTPGIFTGFGVNSAIDASPKLITAANDVTGLLNALLGSLLNSLASLAVNSATGAVNAGLSGNNGGVSGIPPSTINAGSQTSTIASVPLSCNPPMQTVSSTFPATIGAVGGTTDANGNAPTYTWTSSDGQTGNGYIFSPMYNLAGTYTVTVNDSASDTPATCKVIVQ